MRWLLVPFFIVRLVMEIVPFLFLFFLKTFHFYSLLTCVVLSSWPVILLVLHLKSNSSLRLTPPPAYFPILEKLNQTISVEQRFSTRHEDLTEVTEVWQTELKKQPHHRDLLINAALATEYAQNPEAAKTYWAQAHQADPNFVFFQ